MNTSSQASAGNTIAVHDVLAVAVDFTLHVAGRSVPGTLWSPATTAMRSRPVVLVGHGGSGHRRSGLVLDVVERMADGHGFHVAAIDGPVHGARRQTVADGDAVREEFRALWRKGTSIDPMVADWRATIDWLCRRPDVDPAAIAWYGVSMGTAYGIPLVASESRIKAAVLGMWGTSREGSERLVADAPRIHCPVLFQRKRDDALFTVDGQEALFAAIGSADKQLRVYAGGHVDPAGEQLADSEAFLLHHLDPGRH